MRNGKIGPCSKSLLLFQALRIQPKADISRSEPNSGTIPKNHSTITLESATAAHRSHRMPEIPGAKVGAAGISDWFMVTGGRARVRMGFFEQKIAERPPNVNTPAAPPSRL